MNSRRIKQHLIVTIVLGVLACILVIAYGYELGIKLLLYSTITGLLLNLIALGDNYLRLVQRVRQLEQKVARLSSLKQSYPVDAERLTVTVGNGGGQDELAEAEFDVILEEVPADREIAILKVVRSLTGVGLAEAKQMVESVPTVVKVGIAKAAAESAKMLLEEAGATVTVVGYRL